MSKDLSKLRNEFLEQNQYEWFCANTYDRNYKAAPEKSGVYFIVEFDMLSRETEIVYVGSSTDLSQRYRNHNIRSMILEKPNKHAVFYFKEIEKGFYDLEIQLIKKLQPKYNKITYKRIK